MRITPEDMLKEIQKRLTVPTWNYSFKPHEWFFPGDVAPHSTSFKYKCNKLYELGLLERSEGYGRWGYRYRVPISKSDIELL